MPRLLRRRPDDGTRNSPEPTTLLPTSSGQPAGVFCFSTMNARPTLTLLAELRSLPRAYWVLVTGWFVNRFGTFVYPFLTLFLTERGHSPSSVAWVLAASGMGQFMSSLLG